MEGMRGYTTAIVVGFLIVALSVLGLRWHALSQRASAATPAALYSYAPPKRGSNGSVPHANSSAVNSGKSRGVSPSKSPTKPAPSAAETKPKSTHKPDTKVLPKLHSININKATQAQLEQLPGIGPALASRIVSHRNQHGAFKDVDGLDDVKGIGPKKLADIAPYCYVE